VIDTALAALYDALLSAGDIAELAGQLAFLLRQQQADGGFPWLTTAAAARAAIVPTAHALLDRIRLAKTGVSALALIAGSGCPTAAPGCCITRSCRR